MAKLRHIALIVADPEESAGFFASAFGMRRCGEIYCGCYMTDGVVSVALLKKEFAEERIGIDHFGMWVEDLASAGKDVETLGATRVSPSNEVKFLTPDGILFELSENGWPGAVKDPSAA